jgi:hypothetical protein
VSAPPSRPRRKAAERVSIEFRGGDEAGIEAILDGPIRERDGEMRLAPAGFAHEDEIAALGDEVRGERRTEEREAHRRPPREVEVVGWF